MKAALGLEQMTILGWADEYPMRYLGVRLRTYGKSSRKTVTVAASTWCRIHNNTTIPKVCSLHITFFVVFLKRKGKFHWSPILAHDYYRQNTEDIVAMLTSFDIQPQLHQVRDFIPSRSRTSDYRIDVQPCASVLLSQI